MKIYIILNEAESSCKNEMLAKLLETTKREDIFFVNSKTEADEHVKENRIRNYQILHEPNINVLTIPDFEDEVVVVSAKKIKSYKHKPWEQPYRFHK